MGRFVLRVVRNIFPSALHPFKYTPFAAAAAIQSPSTQHSANFHSVVVPDNQTNHKITNQTTSNNFKDITTSSSSVVRRGGIRVKKNLLSRKPTAVTHTTNTNNNNTAVELAFNSVVKIFTVSCSPNYLLPWQNKSQRESMGSGLF
jgi:hypothetical protein